MKSNLTRIIVIFLVVFMFLTLFGCSANIPEDSELTGKESEQGTISAVEADSELEILRQEAKRFLQRDKKLTITARELYNDFILKKNQNYYLVDIRGGGHYADAHIAGAVNIPYADTWKLIKTELLPKDKTIVLICYSGHTSAQTQAFWGMLGHDVVVLKYGMAGWSKNPAVIGSTPINCEAFDFPVVTTIPKEQSYDIPEINEGINDLKALLHKRAEVYLKANYKPVILAEELKTSMEKNAEDIFILDIRNTEHYNNGHIENSINIPFSEVAKIDNLEKLPSDKKIIVVGYDGHDSSAIVRILNTLNYKAVALKDGMAIWKQDEDVIGAKNISCDDIKNLPTEKLNYQPKTDSAPATCSG